MPPAHAGEAWYRNPWVWLVIAIPSLTVAGCLFTAYLALAHPDDLVREGEAPGVAAGSLAEASP